MEIDEARTNDHAGRIDDLLSIARQQADADFNDNSVGDSYIGTAFSTGVDESTLGNQQLAGRGFHTSALPASEFSDPLPRRSKSTAMRTLMPLVTC